MGHLDKESLIADGPVEEGARSPGSNGQVLLLCSCQASGRGVPALLVRRRSPSAQFQWLGDEVRSQGTLGNVFNEMRITRDLDVGVIAKRHYTEA